MRIPATVEGQLLGLADRIQTITAMFGIGSAPTGSKDPLRCAVLPTPLSKYWLNLSFP